MLRNLANIEFKKKLRLLHIVFGLFFGWYAVMSGDILLGILALIILLTASTKRIIITDNSRKRIKIKCDSKEDAENFINDLSIYLNK